MKNVSCAIYGAGSLGTVLGAYITKNGGKVDLINRNKAHVEALKKNGAKITKPSIIIVLVLLALKVFGIY